MKLSPRKQRFVDEYLIDLNGTQAAIRAGYSRKTANEQSARLLAHVRWDEEAALSDRAGSLLGFNALEVQGENGHGGIYHCDDRV